MKNLLILLIIFQSCSSSAPSDGSAPSTRQNTVVTKNTNSTENVMEPKSSVFNPTFSESLIQFQSDVITAINYSDSAQIMSFFYKGDPFIETYRNYRPGKHWVAYNFYEIDSLKKTLAQSMKFGFKPVQNEVYTNIPKDYEPTEEPSNEGILTPIFEDWSPHEIHLEGLYFRYPELRTKSVFVNYPFTDPILECQIERLEAIAIPFQNVPVHLNPASGGNATEVSTEVIFVSDTVLWGCSYYHKYFTYKHLVNAQSDGGSDDSEYHICLGNNGPASVNYENAIGSYNMTRLYLAHIEGEWKIVAIRLPGKFAKAVGC